MLSRGCDDAHLMFACVSDALLAGAVLRHRFASFLARLGCLSKRRRKTTPSLAAASADGGRDLGYNEGLLPRMENR